LFGYTCALIEQEDGKKRFCTVANNITKQEKTYLILELTLDAFIDGCDKLSDDDIAQMAVKNALKTR
jgi:hypothetical protein